MFMFIFLYICIYIYIYIYDERKIYTYIRTRQNRFTTHVVGRGGAPELTLVQSEGGLTPDDSVTNNTESWRIAHAASPSAKVPPDLHVFLTAPTKIEGNTRRKLNL